MEKVAKIETTFIRTHMNLQCPCKYDVHIKCYNDWRLYTSMLCPICRVTENLIKKRYTCNYIDNNISLLIIFFIYFIILWFLYLDNKYNNLLRLNSQQLHPLLN
jgi:hypothetical protein